MLHRPQLFQRFGELQRGGREGNEALEHLAAVGVDADVAQGRFAGADRRAGEVDGVAYGVTDDFDDVACLKLLVGFER